MKNSLVLECLRKGFFIYKDNFKLLFGASLLYALVEFLYLFVSFFCKSNASAMFFLIDFIVGFATIYFTLRLVISIIIIIKQIIKDKEITLRSAYIESSQYFWRYIGNIILVAFALIIPIIIIALIQQSELAIIYKYAIIAVSVLVIGIIISYLFFAPLSVVTDPKLNRRVGLSMKLVKGRVFQVLLVFFVSSFIIYIPSFVLNFSDFRIIAAPYATLINNTISNIINLIVMPFSLSVWVTLYYELKKEKNM